MALFQNLLFPLSPQSQCLQGFRGQVFSLSSVPLLRIGYGATGVPGCLKGASCKAEKDSGKSKIPERGGEGSTVEATIEFGDREFEIDAF